MFSNSIKENVIPILTESSKLLYINEEDILNVTLLGMTAREWKNNLDGKKYIVLIKINFHNFVYTRHFT